MTFSQRRLIFADPLTSSELWHIFHDELDLDGNGELDQGELHSALNKAGVYCHCYHRYYYDRWPFLSTINIISTRYQTFSIDITAIHDFHVNKTSFAACQL